jgi:uncharacterized protein
LNSSLEQSYGGDWGIEEMNGLLKWLRTTCFKGMVLIAALAFNLNTDLAQAANAGIYSEIQWEMLIPKGWDPAFSLDLPDLATLSDRDPRAMAALQAMKAAWDNAPAEPSMNGRNIRIPGFMIPLDKTGESVQSFLLVPYFGACIHSPPPPSNQMIQVLLDKPLMGFHTMDSVWVYGVMEVERTDSPWGKTTYVVKAAKVEAYNP